MKTADLVRRLRTDAPILRDWWSAGRTGDVSLSTIAMLEDAAEAIEVAEAERDLWEGKANALERLRNQHISVPPTHKTAGGE